MNADSPPVTASLGFDVKDKASKLRGTARLPPTADPRSARILVVDSDPALRRLLSIRLAAASYHVDSVDGARAALDACMRTRPNLVITDLRMEPMDGLGLLKELKSRWPELSVIILTAHGTIPEAVQATQCGAFGFLVKPIEKAELLGQVQRAIAASIPKHLDDQWRTDIVSRSQLMEMRLRQANKAADTDCPVKLTGESGTGRELFARAIHAASSRRDRPFIAVACRARADVRLICTTSDDLKHLVDAGLFREDLYYRIEVLPIEVPPLGRRREDIRQRKQIGPPRQAQSHGLL